MSLVFFRLYVLHSHDRTPACCPDSEGVTKWSAPGFKGLTLCYRSASTHKWYRAYAVHVVQLQAELLKAQQGVHCGMVAFPCLLRQHSRTTVASTCICGSSNKLQTGVHVVDDHVVPTDSGINLPGVPRPLLLPSGAGSAVNPFPVDPNQDSALTAQQGDGPHE